MRALAAVFLLATTACLPAEWGANAIVVPYRKPVRARPDLPHQDISFVSDGLSLRGWLLPAAAPRRGLIVYLHGIGDNREGGLGLAHRFGPQGYDVLAYDSRAHGSSQGSFCTYGVRESHDLARALDAVKADRAILFGTSLGAAVALQAAPLDGRIAAVIAQSPFSDLGAIVAYRAPWFATRAEVAAALREAERRAAFRADEASALEAARAVRVPVLLIHGAEDRDTPPDQGRRVFEALGGPKRLVLVPGAGHNETLRGAEVWRVIEEWLGALQCSQRSCTSSSSSLP
jgi:pimeloyl-ACP methyl ester carboxylesterase